MLHVLLKNQLDQFGILDPTLPPDADTWRRLLDTISATYEQSHQLEFTRPLFEQTNDGVFILALDMTLISVNQKAADMLVYTIPELLQMALPEVISPDEVPHSAAIAQAVLAGQRVPPFERTLRRKDGGEIAVEMNTELVRDDQGNPNYLQGIIRDISERKRTEHALRERETLYRTLVRNLPNVVVLMFDRDMRYVLAEGGTIFRYGYSKETFEGKTIWEAISLERQNLYLPYYEAALAGRESQFETERGGYIYEVHIVPARDDNGNIIGGLNISEDITERKRVEAAQRRQEALYRALVKNLPNMAVIMFDSAYHYILVEGGILDRHENLRTSYVNSNLWDTFSSERAEFFLPIYQSALAGKPVDYSFEMDGYFYTAHFVPVRDESDTIIAAMSITEDVTESKRAGDALRRSEERFRTLVQNLHVGVLLQGPNGEVFLFNQAALDLLAVSEDQIFDRVPVDPSWNIIHEDGSDFPKAMQPVPQAIETGKPVRDAVMGVFHPDTQDRVWLLVNAEPSLGIDGTVKEVICTFRDISARKQAEDALRESERRYHELFEGIDDAVFVHDMEANLLDVNEAACRRLGYSRNELLSMKTTQIDDPDYGRGFYDRLERQKSGFDLSDNYGAHITKDGRRIDVHTNSKLISYRGQPAILSVIRDVTALREAESAIRFQAALVDHISDAIYSTDMNDFIMTWNRSAERMYGWSADEAIGQFTGKMVGSHLIGAERTAALKQIHELGFWEGEIVHTSRTGRIIQVWVSTTLLRDRDGNPAGQIAISRDITERKQAQEALRQSEEKYRQLFDAAQWQAQELTLLNRARAAVATEMDLAPLIRTVVKAIGEIFTYTYVSLYLLEDDHLLLYHQIGYDAPYPIIQLNQGIIGRTARMGTPIFVDDVTTDPEYLSAANDITSEISVPLFDRERTVGVLNIESSAGRRLTKDDMRLMIALSEQISIAVERARLYTSLRESTEQYQNVLSSVREVIFQVNERSQWSFLNAAWVELTGYSVEASLGQPILDILHPDDREITIRQYRPLVKHEIPFSRYETRIITQEGSPRWIEVHARPTANAQGETVGLSGTLTDISERKRSEQQAAELLAQSHTMEALRRFLDNVSHDLRTPLSVITTSLYLMRRKLAEPETAIRHLDILEEQVSHLARIVEDVVEISRLEDQIVEFEFIPLYIGNLVRDVLVSYETIAQDKEITLTHQADPDLPVIQADQMWIGRMMRNLIDNAIQYTPNGGTITLKTGQQDDGILLTIQDNGIGIGPEDIPHIFDRFYRADSARPTTKGGTGLGLAIVRKVVDMHGGRINVQSVPAQGSTFTVWLPIRR
ncbi:MAG: PAS domain S-box protein [Chloroflexota bacterium]